MNTSALKRFAQQARSILKDGVEKRIHYWGFDKKGNLIIPEPQELAGGMTLGEQLINDPTAYKKWRSLREAIQHKGLAQVAEEAAYTWFNRLIAIRILSRNGYITPQLSFESEAVHTPIIVTNAKLGILPTLDTNQQKLYNQYIGDDTLETELFSLLITAYCHESHLLQQVFGRLDDYSELLLPSNILAVNGFIHLLNTTDAITNEDYQKVELIGWLYQFYISEKKDEVFKSFKNGKKAEAADIPAATQIFTPNWIVKYMVQNTVGRIWLDLNPASKLRQEMIYLVENPDTEKSTKSLVSEVAKIKLLDPACGSGHILVEGFDLLFAMYREEGYSKREAVRNILRNNLFGLELDPRAAQLATFAVLLKAAVEDRSALECEQMPQIYAMPEPYDFEETDLINFMDGNISSLEPLTKALELMQQAQNLGSIMKLDMSEVDFSYIDQERRFTSIFTQQAYIHFCAYMNIIRLLTQKYEAVAANPPYMGSGNMNGELKKYVNKNYPKSKADLFAVFMEQGMDFTCENGRMGMINMHSWMFLSSFEALRKSIIENYQIENMLHLGPHTFDELGGEVVQNAAFVLLNGKSYHKSTYFRLIEYPNGFAKKQMFLKNTNRYDNINQSNFIKIPGVPIAYWVSEKMIFIFSKSLSISDIAQPRRAIQTGDSSRFIRNWAEVSYHNIQLSYNKSNDIKWYKFDNGGNFRKWYGNLDFVINWIHNGKEIKDSGKAIIANEHLYFRDSIIWNKVSGKKLSFRFHTKDVLCGDASPFLISDKYLYELIGLLNSNLSFFFIGAINPTLNLQSGDIARMPFITTSDESIKILVIQNILISHKDWDSRETSWDFQDNELIKLHGETIQLDYENYCDYWTNQFRQLHANEEELNRLFIDIYGLHDELTPEVKLKDITILKDELEIKALGDATSLDDLPEGKLPFKTIEVISQLISYAIGCLMGRYRLNSPGLHIAHSNPTDKELESYAFNDKVFNIDADGIIPLMDKDCSFSDNALNRIKDFIELVWGDDKILVDNINFIEAAFGKTLENYLIKDFWPAHCKRYQKRPIYWLFSSPKGAFKVLTYMHRMNRFTVEKIRSNYLLKYIQNLDNRIKDLEPKSASLSRDELRSLEKLKTDLIECKEYDLLLKDVADQQISFDLDDGVVVNYQKFATVVAPIK